MSRAKLFKFIKVVVMLATFSTSAVFGQPGQPQQQTVDQGQLEEQHPADEPINGSTPQGVEPIQQQQPACPPKQQVAQQPDPRPTPAVAQNYSDGRSNEQTRNWRQGRAIGPAYQPQPAIQQTVNQYIQQGLDDDRIFGEAQKRYLDPVKVVRKDGYNDYEVSESGKIVFFRLSEKHFLDVVPNGNGSWKVQFRSAKKREIVDWLLNAADHEEVQVVRTALHDFRDWTKGQIDALKIQGGAHKDALVEIVDVLVSKDVMDQAAADELKKKIVKAQPGGENATVDNTRANNATINATISGSGTNNTASGNITGATNTGNSTAAPVNATTGSNATVNNTTAPPVNGTNTVVNPPIVSSANAVAPPANIASPSSTPSPMARVATVVTAEPIDSNPANYVGIGIGIGLLAVGLLGGLLYRNKQVTKKVVAEKKAQEEAAAKAAAAKAAAPAPPAPAPPPVAVVAIAPPPPPPPPAPPAGGEPTPI